MSWTIGVEGLRGVFPDGCVVTMGVFDGVHRGHIALIRETTRWAQAHGVPAVALTFDPHPAAVLAPRHRPPMLCPLAHRVERLLQQGISWVVIQPFTAEFAHLAPEAFVEQVLKRDLNACAVVVGDDFRFGRGRAGDIGTLRRLGVLEVLSVASVVDESGERISSTRIRELVQAGHLEQANALLGEPLHWAGIATRGDGRGREFGYPTANLVPIEPLITPKEGVYACLAQLQSRSHTTHPEHGGSTYAAAVSVGKPPMFEHARGRVEAYLIDFPDEDLYGRVLTLQFLKRLRPQQRFESIDCLLAQMACDVEQTRQIAQEVQSGR